MIKTMDINEVIKSVFINGVSMLKSTKSQKCLARVPNKGNLEKIKFCNKPSKFNDLCEKHDKKFKKNTNCNYFNHSLK